jgi:hypothetical protein
VAGRWESGSLSHSLSLPFHVLHLLSLPSLSSLSLLLKIRRSQILYVSFPSEIGARTLAGILFFFFSFVISFWFQNLLIMRRMALGTLALTTLTSVPSNFSPAFVWQFVLAIIIDSAIASG